VTAGITMKEAKWNRKVTTNRCPSPAKSFIFASADCREH
jgi:hypothetical protein